MNRVFIHVAAMGNYREVTNEIIKSLLDSGLAEKAIVTIGIVGGEIDKPDGVNVVRFGGLDQYEFPTLALMQSTSRDFPCDNYLYMHTKGVSTPDNFAIADWRQYMTYFCVNKWEQCVEKLQNGYDCVGVDWRCDPVPHYSGNFWWATGNHIAGLPDINALSKPGCRYVISIRHNAEFWISMASGMKPCCLWDCGIGQYERHMHRYPKEKYNGSV